MSDLQKLLALREELKCELKALEKELKDKLAEVEEKKNKIKKIEQALAS